MRRTMKKAVAVGLAAATAFSLCACGGGDGSKGSSKDALEVLSGITISRRVCSRYVISSQKRQESRLMYRLRSGIHTGHFLRLEHQVEICRMYSGCTPTTHRCT